MESAYRLSRRQFLYRSGLLAAGTTIALSSGGLLTAIPAGGAVKPAATGLDTVKFQLGWLKLAQFGGHFVALQNGYFAEEGIDAQFLSGGSGIDGLTLVESGQVTMADANGSDVLTAVSKNIPLQCFGTIYQSTPNALMSLGKEPLTSLQSLKGKTVGLPNGEQQLLSAMLTRRRRAELCARRHGRDGPLCFDVRLRAGVHRVRDRAGPRPAEVRLQREDRVLRRAWRP